MSILRLCVCFLIAISCCTACKKDNSSGSAGKRLHQIVSGDADSLFYVSFHYDASNKLTGYTSTNNNNVGYRSETTLQYDAQENPVHAQSISYNDQGTASPYIENDSLVYQSNRVVKKFTSYFSAQPYPLINVYNYNALGNISNDTLLYHNQANDIERNYINYTYDANENIVQWESFPKQANAPGNPIIATYNTTPNAYRTLGNWIYFFNAFGESDIKPTLLSKYNVSGIDYGIFAGVSFKQSYQYKYDQDGFINKIIITGNDYGRTYTLTTTFYYE